ncbi:MAG: type II toxin-antitoxin system VapC family toxin [Gemmataceae bacterium]
MSFLFDTDICSYHLKRPSGLIHRFVQYSGRLHLPTIVLAELFAWAYRRPNPASLLQAMAKDLLPDVTVLDFDSDCAEQFGKTRGTLLQQGIQIPTTDLMIASVALVHNLTLVTHNTTDFQNIPVLRLDDWLIP